jgi:hypothetical protein
MLWMMMYIAGSGGSARTARRMAWLLPLLPQPGPRAQAWRAGCRRCTANAAASRACAPCRPLLGTAERAKAPGQPHRARHAQQQRAHGQPAAEAVHGEHAAVQQRLHGKALQQAALAAKAEQQQAEALPAARRALSEPEIRSDRLIRLVHLQPGTYCTCTKWQ